MSFVRRARRRKEYSSSSDRNAAGTAFRFPFPFFPTLIAILCGRVHKSPSEQERMVVVNCDQDYKPDLNPRPLVSPKPQSSDTQTVTATTTTAMSTTTDTPNEGTNASATRRSINAVFDAAVSEVWYLKPVTFAGRRTRIITQNFNGSVSIACHTETTSRHALIPVL